jgi:ribosomal protein S17
MTLWKVEVKGEKPRYVERHTELEKLLAHYRAISCDTGNLIKVKVTRFEPTEVSHG